MVDVVLVYPYFNPKRDRSIFRVPPLGLGYVASYLEQNGVEVDLVDCTFLEEEAAIRKITQLNPRIVGIYSMFSLREDALRVARAVKGSCELLVAGGPLPTVDTHSFTTDFDIVVKGEGERTMLEVTKSCLKGEDYSQVPGIFYLKDGEAIFTDERKPYENLDEIPFPARHLFPNTEYIRYWRGKSGKAKTSIITTRGCPFRCDFCSRAVFGVSYRERSAGNVVEEVEDVLELGYEEVFFVDDCFTLNSKRVVKICDEIERRGLKFGWECLSRVDVVNKELAQRMREAGCRRIFFGIESGNDRILKEMGKQFTLEEARRAVAHVSSAGIDVGAFFIVGYPGETEETILGTIRYATSLPLEYLSFTLPYPIPGTGLYEKVKNEMEMSDWERPHHSLVDHSLIYRSKYSEAKLKFAIAKGLLQFEMNKRLGRYSPIIEKPFEKATDYIFRKMK